MITNEYWKENQKPYPYKSFRDWFVAEEEYGEVVRIKTPIKCGDYDNLVELGQGIPGKRPETEMRALARYLHSLPGKPMGLIENPVNNRPDIPVVVNPWATRERVRRGMGLKTNEDLINKFNHMQKNNIKPVVVSREEAPCKENIIPEDKLDLRKDISRCWVEFNQCPWTLCNRTVIVCDEKSGNHSLGLPATIFSLSISSYPASVVILREAVFTSSLMIVP